MEQFLDKQLLFGEHTEKRTLMRIDHFDTLGATLTIFYFHAARKQCYTTHAISSMSPHFLTVRPVKSYFEHNQPSRHQ